MKKQITFQSKSVGKTFNLGSVKPICFVLAGTFLNSFGIYIYIYIYIYITGRVNKGLFITVQFSAHDFTLYKIIWLKDFPFTICLINWFNSAKPHIH